MNILASLLLKTALAGTAQVNNIVQYGGTKNPSVPSVVLPLASMNTMIQLSSFVASSTNGNYLMLSRWSSTGSSGQYQVASGKTFRAFGMYVLNISGTGFFTIGYGTAALGSDNTNTAPTGAVYYSSATGTAGFTDDTSGAWQYFPVFMDFPALSFPFVKTLTNTLTYNVVILGAEQ